MKYDEDLHHGLRQAPNERPLDSAQTIQNLVAWEPSIG
jgi:hypothetical protein